MKSVLEVNSGKILGLPSILTAIHTLKREKSNFLYNLSLSLNCYLNI